ncbi:MAG: hypothetical protein P4L77_01615 [Sulfuriferula sp.]|nr:hypothetical protein [Sulfuriferula sp.]
MKNSTLKGMLTALLASLLAGCVAQTPHLDEKFGEAVNTAKAQQIINPDASQNTDPVAGVDGQAANAAVDRYHKSYERPPAQPNVFAIGVGTGTGAGTGTTP